MNSLLLLISAFLAVVSGKPSYEHLENYSFELYVKEFSLSFPEHELPEREKLFYAELDRIKAHNAQNKGWKEGVSRFTAMKPSEKSSSFGLAKSMRQHLKSTGALKSAQPLPLDFQLESVDKLPTSVDWREEGIVTAVKDQGHCGSCWAFASTEVMESHIAKASGLLFDLSVEQVAMCTPNPNQCGGSGGCNGATSELAFDYVAHSSGLFQEYQYSYESYYGDEPACALPTGTKPVGTIGGYIQLPMNNYTAVMNAIAKAGPIAIAVDASNWHAYEGGIFSGCSQVNPDINHGVVLVGYGEENGQKYWIVRNSWSPTWGEKGYIRLARSDNDDQNCGSDITPQDGIACAGDTAPEKVCGTCGVIFDTAFPTGAKAF